VRIGAPFDEATAFQRPQRRGQVAALQSGRSRDITRRDARMVIDVPHDVCFLRGQVLHVGVNPHPKLSSDSKDRLGKIGQVTIHGQTLPH
jgi:hypothetical protein